MAEVLAKLLSMSLHIVFATLSNEFDVLSKFASLAGAGGAVSSARRLGLFEFSINNLALMISYNTHTVTIIGPINLVTNHQVSYHCYIISPRTSIKCLFV